ncbi:hypothetical protein R3P38DRAFT_3335893 [Favolaschia claudopus]|uniref:CxC1-like cysteine cluster associated with KDZ transposases domain-containing protein n=1 Tax=Favolaschia claudopus TaxID=2862362 RepID=A0AAV9Z7U8_9AGAR
MGHSHRPNIKKFSTPSRTPVAGTAPHHNSKKRVTPLVYLGGGRTLTQARVPPLFGQAGIRGDRLEDSDPNADPFLQPPAAAPASDPSGTDYEFTVEELDGGTTTQLGGAPSRYAQKRQTQTNRWLHTVLPRLVPIFMDLMATTRDLRNVDRVVVEEPSCACSHDELLGRGKTKHIAVTLYWMPLTKKAALEDITIRICPCSPAASQLVQRGFFPCSPLEPSVAIGLHVLEFARKLFLNLPPNNTAISTTLEEVLDDMGYKLSNRNALRRRFGNALEWYSAMRDLTTAKIDAAISSARHSLAPEAPETPRAVNTPLPHSSPAPTPLSSPTKRRRADTPPPDSSPPSSPPASPSKRRRQRPPSPSSSPPPSRAEYPFNLPEERTRPSEYLRAICPACFGGKWENAAMVLKALVNGDACFTHSRNKGNGTIDPARHHPSTIFVSTDVTDTMDAYVESIRPSRHAAADDEGEPEDDHFEDPRLPVPKSVLDECESSFVAADERRIKSSTKFFDDTGLMALTCRHDHPLFVVNMKSAGEKQANMLALLQMLFSHLPRDFVVGFLYDIVCQLERSLRKWNFFPPEYMERLRFAVSVLHAFGHNWVCQLQYHPRRRRLFGLSDGEGCERFWHSISKLIAYLRVCGYHRRLYVLDTQIRHLRQASVGRLGMWLGRRWVHMKEKQREAKEEFEACGHSRELLEVEHRKQVEAQTKPLPKRSKTAGKVAVEAIIRRRQAVAVLKKRIARLEDTVMDLDADAEDVRRAQDDLRTAQEKLKKDEATLKRKEKVLGVQDRANLAHLTTSKFIAKKMNARALKHRLREKLRNRKFELDRVERTYRRKKKTEHKLKIHIEDAVARRDPGIQTLVRQYNSLCKDMNKLVKERKAPRNSIPPAPIDPKAIWGLDVDDEIWQDVGLDDADEEAEPPLWLKDDTVRSGIKAMLVLDRCEEEQARVVHECRALRYWLAEEWEAVASATAEADDKEDFGLLYQLELRRQELCKLCASWSASIRGIPFNTDDLPPWGPSEDELRAVRLEDRNAKTASREGEEDDEDEVEGGGEEEEHPVEDIEAFQRAEVYAENTVDSYLDVEF